MFFKTGVLKNFVIFTGKHLCRNLFLIKFQDSRPAFLFKKRLQHRYFSENIVKFLRTAFLQDTCSSYFYEISFDDRYLMLFFTIVKLGHIIERTLRQINQNFLRRDGFFSNKISILLQGFCYLIVSLLQRFLSS